MCESDPRRRFFTFWDFLLVLGCFLFSGTPEGEYRNSHLEIACRYAWHVRDGMNKMILNEDIKQKRLDKLRQHINPMQEVPVLRRFNGFGFCLLGTMRDELLLPGFLKVYFFTAAFIPIIPLEIYFVTGSYDSGYRFFGSLSLIKFHSIYGIRSFKIYASAIMEGLFLAFLILLVGFFALCVVFLFKHFFWGRH